MASGPLRERVRFERRSDGSDGAGNYVSDWETLIEKRWAQITPLRGNEEVIASKLQATGVYEIRVRQDSETATVKPADRAVDINTGEAFNIRHIENRDQRDRFLILTCEKGVASG